jgi:hypothetical protein
MLKFCLFLTVFSICVVGCTQGYNVHVNGFSEQGRQIKEGASVYVSTDPNSQNPIFDKEIKTKIEELLRWYDYVPASAVEKSDYRLAFNVRIDSHQSSGFTPLHHPYAGFDGGYRGDYYFGYTTYVPYYDTYYDQRLAMKVFARDNTTDSNSEQVVWIGDAMISTSGDDIRQTINYLLVACFEYFGIDTTRQKKLYITEKDPRIIRIEFVQ